MKIIFKKLFDNRFIIFGILILAFLLRIYNLNQSFWIDEAAQVIESSRGFSQQFQLAADFHPPLYHLLLFFWMKIGISEIWVRLLSVLFGIGSIITVYKTGALLGNKKAGLIASFFLSISPYHIWYSQETRPYMLFVFVSLLSTYFIVKRHWFWYAEAIMLSLYSLYFAPFLIAAHLVFILIFNRKDLKYFLKCIIISLIIFIPWVPSFLNQLKVGTGGFFSGWTDVVSFSPIKSIPLTFAKFNLGHGSFENKLFYGLIVLTLGVYFVYLLQKIWRTREGKTLFILFFVPLLCAIVISFQIPILAPQRLIFLLPVYYLIIAFGLEKSGKNIQIFGFLLILSVSLIGILQYYLDPYTQREDWRSAVNYVERYKDDKSVSLFVFPDPFAPYLWYKKDNINAWGIAPNFTIKDEDLEKVFPRLTDKKRIYLFQYLTGLTDPGGKTIKFISSSGYKESLIKDFPGVGFVYIYDKK